MRSEHIIVPYLGRKTPDTPSEPPMTRAQVSPDVLAIATNPHEPARPGVCPDGAPTKFHKGHWRGRPAVWFAAGLIPALAVAAAGVIPLGETALVGGVALVGLVLADRAIWGGENR